MITYEQIKAANDTIKTTDINGKDYAEVNQRIKAFRMVYPQGFVRTHFFSLENGVCVMLAECGYYDGEKAVVIGTGTAYEKEGSTFINKKSYIENCETSAVGRALGMAGFGIDTSVASADELQNALANQDKASTEQIARITELVPDIPALLKYYKINALEELTEEIANKIIKRKEKKNV